MIRVLNNCIKKKVIHYLFVLILIAGYCPSGLCAPISPLSERIQTDVDRAEHLFDEQGVPILKIKGLGDQRHPGWIAAYALAYAGIDAYDKRLLNLKDENKFQACINWLKSNLKQRQDGLWVWEYHFDSTYNDVSIKAPWSSAFGQALGIQAFLAVYKQNGNPEYLDLAKKAAKSLFTPIAQGGFLYRNSQDIWFEEIPVPVDNPSHILNGHMRALLALKELAEATHDSEIETYFKQGSDTLYRWLPLYDTGYWLRYDLNPKKSELLFRFANPYGFENYPLAIHKITLRDPLTKEEISLNVGTDGDSDGKARIAGVHWGQPETVAGKKVRRLLPAALENKRDELAAPHSYFYLTLPSEWKNNLRKEWYELVIDYYDEARANITLQQRSIAPGQTFRDMRDGDLHITGAGQWREWIIPVRPSDLGFWVGESYADKHALYLKKLAKHEIRFDSWKRVAISYLNLVNHTEVGYKEKKKISSLSLPEQLAMLPIYSLDNQGVLMQNQATKKTKFLPNGLYDPNSDRGIPRYSPFIIAEQLTQGPDVQGGSFSRIDKSQIKKQSALLYFLNNNNQKKTLNAISYQFNFNNTYNDIITKAPWTSAFSQAYVLNALQYAAENNIGSSEQIDQLILKVANSFNVDIAQGGVSTITKEIMRFFEEVPNATHVLNAHLISINELAATSRYLNNPGINNLSWQGVLSLREKLHLFDSGYWLRYDLNPKKELLFQIDWLEGKKSPLIERIELRNPENEMKTSIQVGDSKAFDGPIRISGSDWESEQLIDNKAVRSFQNGYLLRKQAVQGGTKHNVYFVSILPTRKLTDDFDVPVHQLVIHYKDTAPGRFAVKIQSINEGNQLTFVPMRGGIIHTKGDKKWKTAYIQVRPQDLGWYVGPDYQQYEVDQIQRIANLTNDWFFYQYAQKQRDYLETKNKNQTVIVNASSSKNKMPINAVIQGASKTYTGFGFENAFNDTPDTSYVAGIDGEKIAYVNLDLKKAKPLSELSIQWENINNFAKKVRVISLDAKNQRELIQAHIKHGGLSHIYLAQPQKIKRLRIEFSEFSGQPRLLLRQIQLWSKGKNQVGINPTVQEQLDNPYLTASDPKNPLHIFRLPVTQRIKKLSDELAQGVQNDHEKILKFMDYIGRFRVGFATDATPETTINKQVGACGAFTNVLVALAASQGIPSHYLNLMNYPKSQGHTVAEVHYEGKWHLYDPTFNAFYSLQDQLQPLSFSEIKKICNTQPESLHLNAKIYRPGFTSYTGCPIFLNASPSGVIGPDQVMIFPLQFDNKKLKKIEKKDFDTTYQGANFIGAASINQQQEWHIKNLSIGEKYEFIVQPESIGGDITANDLGFSIDAALTNGKLISNSHYSFDFQNQKTLPWIIQFIAQRPEVTLKISHPYLGPKYRYIYISSYELKKTNSKGS
ncbi:D-glucuronyl C5-epimerase family protein [Legionella nagasakiensis]|uniref:D-glucuronyl C5-epimerase family protein n=1 Tax=Legionella nagasakiensis TaxID=535290 RepID=UPI0010569ECE|nr:D-glucuronyl C5-epimerase family protein [Legionella nagasakiensis]